MSPVETAKQIIETATYLSLATTDGNEPWVNAVFFAHDDNYNLYFTSYNDSLHVQNILKNPNVAAVIFDSHIVPGSGKGQGVQIKAKCQRVTGDDLPKAIDVVYSKRFPDPKERADRDLSPDHFSKAGDNERTDHIYKIVPKHFYIIDKSPGLKDTRLEVDMLGPNTQQSN